MKLSIIIPAYNAEKAIEENLIRIRNVKIGKIDKEIIVVDDGSKDKTLKIVSSLKTKIPELIILKHEKNQGKGAAVTTGLNKATGDIFYLQDSDLEYDPEDIPLLVKPILEKKATVVYGSRRMNKSNSYSSKLYKWGGAFVDMLISFVLKSNITDASAGSKAFTRDVYNKIKPLRAKGFDIEAELTAKIVRLNIKPYEQSIAYNPRTHKEGKNIRWYDGFRILKTLIVTAWFSK